MAAEATPSGGFLSKFTVLRGALPELWVVFVIKLVGIVAWSLMNKTFVLWLTADFNYGDRAAGNWVFMWSAFMTLCTVGVGSLTDAIGLRRAFLIGVWVCIIARFFLTFGTQAWIAIGFGMVPLALGEALGTPVMVAAIRRFSTTAQRSISFSIFYASMNVGFWIAALIHDWVRQTLGEPHGSFTIPLIEWRLSTYQTIFFASLLFEIVLLPIIYFGLRNGVEATDHGVVITPEKSKYPEAGLLKALWLTTLDAFVETWRIFKGLWGQSGFYKFLSFLALAACVRMIFVLMDYVYPKFGIRELGPGTPIMTLWGLNSILIIVLVPVVGALTQRITAYSMVSFGSAIAAASVFIMALPTAWFQPLADGWLGHFVGHLYLGVKGEIHPYWVMIFIYVVILSVGESIYSPRLYEYAACIAPKGQEASYMSLSYLPFFFAKLACAPLSGELLARFCPEDGPRNSAAMWLAIALITAIAPVGLFAFRRFIRVAEAGRETSAA